MELKKAVCMWCHGHCRVAVQVEGDELLGIQEDESFPHVKLYGPVIRACPRRRVAREYFYHPTRLNYPLKRVGERGDNRWQQISWDQALDEIGERLRKIVDEYGGESVASCRGTGRTCDEYRARFLNLLGGNLIGATTICYGPSLVVSNAMLGWMPWPFVRPGLTRAIFAVGINRFSYPPTFRSLELAKRAGAKLIVVDPRRTQAAALADMHLQLRPGTDLALLLAMINVIIEEEVYDREFVEQWCHGFEELRRHVKRYTPEWAEPITWVPANEIREAALIYATNKPAASFSALGLDHQSRAIQTIRARYILTALTGNLDVPGGDLMSGPYQNAILEQEVELAELMPEERKRKQMGSDRFKLLSWPGYDLIQPRVREVWGKPGAAAVDSSMAHAPTVYRAMIEGKPYPIKALISVSSNPLLTKTNARLVYEAMKRVSLHVCVDFFLTPTGMLADYVLPGATWLERPYLWNGYGISKFLVASEAAVPAVIPGKHERRNDYEIWRELGVRLGQEQYWPARTLEEEYDRRLSPMGMGFAQFAREISCDFPKTTYKKYESTGFATPTGKVELYSTVLEKLGYPPLPDYEEPPEGHLARAELIERFPLILMVGGRSHPFYHSEHYQIDRLRKIHPYPRLQINPSKAKELGIEDGDWVWIETPIGRIKERAFYFDGVPPDVVHAEHGWWFPERDGAEPTFYGLWESNANVLVEDDPAMCDPISGGWPRNTICRVYPFRN